MSERTTKCKLMTSEMSWREILDEAEKLGGDNDAIMSLSFGERLMISSAMFAEHRHNIIKSLPKDLSERELKNQIYFRPYGEYLPADFFKDEE